MTELTRLIKKRDKIAIKAEVILKKLTKASQAQLKAQAVVDKLTKQSTDLTVEKTKLDAMIAAGQNAGVEIPKFLGEKG